MLNSGAAVPSGLTHSAFLARPLISEDAELDYACYMASLDVIRVHSAGNWPVEGFTLEENRRLVAIHEADHRARRAFAFLLCDTAGRQAVGGLYLNPLHEYLERVGGSPSLRDGFPAATAMVSFWVRQDLQHTELPRQVATAVDTWLAAEWPLDAYVFRILPGERSSRAALEAAGIGRLELALPAECLPYLWFGRSITAQQ